MLLYFYQWIIFWVMIHFDKKAGKVKYYELQIKYIVGLIRYINILTSIQDYNIKKTPPNIEVCLGSLRAMLECWTDMHVANMGFLKVLCTKHMQKGYKLFRRNPPEVRVTSGQKSSTKIIYIVL